MTQRDTMTDTIERLTPRKRETGTERQKDKNRDINNKIQQNKAIQT